MKIVLVRSVIYPKNMSEPMRKPSEHHENKSKRKNKRRSRRKSKHRSVTKQQQTNAVGYSPLSGVIKQQKSGRRQRQRMLRPTAHSHCDNGMSASVHNAVSVWSKIYETAIRWHCQHQNNYWRNLAEQRECEIERWRTAYAAIVAPPATEPLTADEACNVSEISTHVDSLELEAEIPVITESPRTFVSPSMPMGGDENRPAYTSPQLMVMRERRKRRKRFKRGAPLKVASGEANDNSMIIDQSYVDFLVVTHRHRADLARRRAAAEHTDTDVIAGASATTVDAQPQEDFTNNSELSST